MRRVNQPAEAASARAAVRPATTRVGSYAAPAGRAKEIGATGAPVKSVGEPTETPQRPEAPQRTPRLPTGPAQISKVADPVPSSPTTIGAVGPGGPHRSAPATAGAAQSTAVTRAPGG